MNCHAVAETKSKSGFFCMTLMMMAPTAQNIPATTARISLKSVLFSDQGSSSRTMPAKAATTGNQFSPRIFSERTGQAKIRIQNGMVYTRIDVLPAPPLTSAQRIRPVPAAVCVRPSRMVRGTALGRTGMPRQRMMRMRRMPPSDMRNALKSKGPMYTRDFFITTQL